MQAAEESDDGAQSLPDRLDQSEQAPARVMQTIGDAVVFVQERISAHVRADDHGSAAGPSAQRKRGKNEVRMAFYTLLPRQQQRQIFLHAVGVPAAWPHVQTLFGAPPYSFLEQGDAVMLNARGFSAGRANMTFDTVQLVASYAQFGLGHFKDALDRDYNVTFVMNGERTVKDMLLFDTRALAAGHRLVLQARVKRHRRADRLQMVRAGGIVRKGLAFPMPGESIDMQMKQAVRSKLYEDKVDDDVVSSSSFRLRVRVQRTVPRGQRCLTAAILAIVE